MPRPDAQRHSPREAEIHITESTDSADELRAALSLSDQHYRLLADRAIDVVFENDADRRVTWASSNLTRALGWAQGDLLGTRLLDLIHPDDVPELEAPPHGSAADEHPFVLRFLMGDGNYRWVAGTATAVESPTGELWSVVTAVRDVDELVLARQRAETSDEFLRQLIDSLPDPHVVLAPVRDEDGRIVDFTFTHANAEACAFNRLPREQLVGTRLLALHPASATSGLFHSYVAVVETGEPLALPSFEYPQDLLAGEIRHYEVHAEPVAGCVSQTWRDITDRVEATAALESAEQRYRLLAENAMDMVLSLDTHAIITWVSPSARQLLGHDPDSLVGRSGGDLIHPDDLPTLLDTATEARAGRTAVCRIRLLTSAGEPLWVEAVPRGIYDHDDTLVGGVIGFRDIHQEVLSQAALRHEQEFDALTGLAKRDLALARIQDVLDDRGEAGFALLCLGVNGMTSINLAYTHATGDRVLATVAERLVDVAGASDRVARVAGDEFAILLRDVTTAAEAVTAAERVLAAVRGPVTVGDTEIEVQGCVGIALANGLGAIELLGDAIAAMHRASDQGTNRWDFLQGDMGQRAREALATQTALRAALGTREIQAWFMPIVRIDEGRLVGYEALVRWCRQDGTVINPADFIDVAEHSGLILELDRTVLTQALRALHSLPPDFHIAVNVSGASLTSGSLLDWVQGELLRSGVDPHRLEMEATETSYFHATAAVRDTMRVLADLGVAWWVDDFGTGYSSISHLRDLPITGIKLDRTFTAEVTNRHSHAAGLAQGLAGLARGLGLLTVAEGVETEAQAAALAEQGWLLGQGYLYGRAAPL